MEKVKIKLTERSHEYEVKVGNGILKNLGFLNEIFPNSRHVAIVSNQKVFRLYGKLLQDSLNEVGFKSSVCLIGDGEKHKSFNSLKQVLDFLSENKFRRDDFLIAFGGGVVGDLAGFASAIYLRGIRFVQIPTTLLAMIDASVGGKTAINSSFGKNLIGAFHHPSAVIADIETLKTLPLREFSSGIYEAIKQASLSEKKMFNEIVEFLEKFPVRKFKRFFSDEVFLQCLERTVAEQIRFKAQIVSQDDREDIERRDKASRKILNFGHTIGHAIEKVTDYKHFKHGEAVGVGMLVEAEISRYIAGFPDDEIKLLNAAVDLGGKLPELREINKNEIINAISFDKKNLANLLEWVLLESIGKPKIFDGREISDKIISRSIEKVLSKRR